jgi:hypothetical protein
MKLRPLVYVTELESALRFWTALGFAPTPLKRRNIIEIARGDMRNCYDRELDPHAHHFG